MFQDFYFKICFLNRLFRLPMSYYQRTTCWKMTMVWGKKIFDECVACVWLTIGKNFWVFAFFMSIGFLMRVITISFAIRVDV